MDIADQAQSVPLTQPVQETFDFAAPGAPTAHRERWETPVFPPEPLKPQPCSWSECANGHHWAPRIAVVECVGCKAPVLATEMVNCPVCNEPCVRTTLRTEHLTRAMGLQSVCKGEPSRGESGVMVAERSFYKESEKNK